MPEPKVRFKRDDGSSYPTWETIPMSEIFTEISEKNHPEMPVLSVQQGVGTVLRDASDRNILYDKSNLKNYKAMKKDDYIIHLRSFEGGLECSNYDGISSPAYRILRAQKIIPSAYRDYFRSYEFIHNKLAVSVVGIRDGKNIDMETFWQIPMSVPCTEEQQKIADFLSSVDEVITASEQEVANLETQKKAVMKKVFSQEVRFKRADGSNFPEWKESTIGSECEFINGKAHEKCEDENGIYTIINSKFISTEGVVRRKTNVILEPLYVDDIVMVMSDVPNGKAMSKCLVIDKNNSYTLNQRICALRTNNISSFVANQISRCDYFMSFDDGIKQTNLRKQDILECPLYIPCLEEQRFIADFLSDFDEAIAAAKKELELWKELKKGLLQQMFV